MSRAAESMPTNVAEVLRRGMSERPHAEALCDARRRLTYAELDVAVDAVCDGLAAEGIGPGDRLAVSLPNSVDVVIAALASARLGSLFVGLHRQLHPREHDTLLVAADADVLITDTAWKDAEQAAWNGHRLTIDLAGDGITALAGPPSSRPPITPETPFAIAFTSGTTGQPKGVVHDHRHVLLPGQVILLDRLGGRGERIGAVLPLTTLNVQILAPMLALLGGGSCVCIDTRHASELAEWIEQERIEHLSCPPATVHDLIEMPGGDSPRIRRLRLGAGGAACPERLRTAYRQRFGTDFTTGYGLSEAPSAVTQETERHPHRAGASGVAMAHVEVRVVDEDGCDVARGEPGQIAVGPAASGRWARQWSGMLGYWRDPDATDAARSGSLLLTGDEGRLDADGYLYVADRRSSIINRGGSKVSPAEVERVLREHPAVADCIVLGRPEQRLGEEVVAVVERRPGADVDPATLLAHCDGALSRYKIPTALAVTDRLERNSMGKIVRETALRELTAPVPVAEAE